MFEKIKDALYEISDILLALAIILIMSTVITWKVTDSLAYSKEKIPKMNEIAKNNKTSIAKDTTIETTLPIIEEKTNSSDTDQESIQGKEDPQDIPNASIVDEEPIESTPKPTIVHIQVPSGTPGVGIAKILKEKGLIENTAKFIARVEELKMASKLKSGTFDIETGSSLDDIIYIIVGKKK